MATSPPSITALPTPPDPNNRATFNALAYPWSVAQQTLATEVGAVASNVYGNAVAAAGAATAAGATVWVSGTTYAIGDARYSPVDFQTYRRKTNGAGTTDPSTDGTNWARINLTADSVLRSARTSNTVLAGEDRASLIDITSGTFSQTFSAAATLTAGWYCYIRNSGTGVITLDPNGAELIDGLASYAMYSGETRLVMCDGTALLTVVLTAFRLEPTTTMTFIEPPGYRAYEVLMCAPGGGGGSGRQGATSTDRSGGGGGGGGGFAWGIVGATPGGSITLTVGANGVGGAAQSSASTNGLDGTDGGTHLFGSHFTVAGGIKGVGGVTTTGSAGTGGGYGFAQLLGSTGGAGGGGTNTSGANGIASGSNPASATGGGGGGGITAANAAQAGGTGGLQQPGGFASIQTLGGAGGVSAGTRPGGTGIFTGARRSGTGGGGGASSVTLAGAAGGNGLAGGGGGGGSASVNGQPSGAGGNGVGYYMVGGLY